MNILSKIVDFFHRFENPRRRKMRQRPFPMEWEHVLAKKWPLWNKLKPDAKNELRNHIKVFQGEKLFEGCGGLVINDEIRVLVAAQACLLLLGNVVDNYPVLRVILIYPSKYRARVKDILPAGIVQEGDQWRSGESWSRGNVVLAWDEVLQGAAVGDDGSNLVLHEFAHQIDTALGITSKTEAWVERRVQPRSKWITAFADEYMDFLERIQRNEKPLFDSYGAQNAAEFFAVITESFVEQPVRFQTENENLYNLMIELFGFNPQEIYS